MADTLSSLDLIRGDDNFVEMFLERKDVDGVWQPLDLSTVTKLWFTAKASWEDADDDAFFLLTIGDGITVTDAENGLALARIEPDVTRALTALVRYVYDVQYLEPGNAEIQTADRGRLTVLRDATYAVS